MAGDDYTTADVLTQMGFSPWGRNTPQGFFRGVNATLDPVRGILQGGDVMPSEIHHTGQPEIGRTAWGLGQIPITGGMPFAEAGALGAGGGRIKQPRSTVTEPLWEPQYPDIYLPPKELIKNVRPLLVPESPALSQVFGTTRAELAQMAREQGKMTENIIEPWDFLKMAKDWQTKPGSPAMEKLFNPQNEARILNALEAFQKEPILRDTTGWYVMDPAYQDMVRMYGKQDAPRAYNELNMMMAPYSMGSGVPSEIKRGLAAHYLYGRGEQDLMRTHGSLGQPNPEYAGVGSLQDLGILGVPGTKFNKSQSNWMLHWLEHGVYPNAAVPKVNIYARSSGVPVPGVGMQRRWPVPDSHDMRSSGAPEAREAFDVGEATMPEMQTYGPWFENEIARKLGRSARELQPLKWTGFGPATGVQTGLGPGKLELLANRVLQTAERERLPISRAGLQEAKRRLFAAETYALPFAGIPLGATLLQDPGQQQ